MGNPRVDLRKKEVVNVRVMNPKAVAKAINKNEVAREAPHEYKQEITVDVSKVKGLPTALDAKVSLNLQGTITGARKSRWDNGKKRVDIEIDSIKLKK